MLDKTTGAGEQFPALSTSISPEQMCSNARLSLKRGLRQLKPCKVHDTPLSIAMGGPSLNDTFSDLKGYIGAANGSLGFLIDKGVLPHACAVLDPSPHLSDIVRADRQVRYFIASICDPSVFDKLKDCDVTLWHPSGQPGLKEVLDELAGDYIMIGGGTTVGLRWINLGYICGFREFHLHGFDSSFRADASHAYSDRQDWHVTIDIDGRLTRMNFLAQVHDFFAMLDRLKALDPIRITVHGDGLLQDRWRVWREKNPDVF